MIRDNRKVAAFAFRGGLELEEHPLNIQPGALISCRNFRVRSGGGYERINGFEAYDGRTSPSSLSDRAQRDAMRALIQPVPGSGRVLGVWVFRGEVYAFRNAVDGNSAKMYRAKGTGWEEVTTGVTLAPDGHYEFVNFNFFASTNNDAMYGVDGTNKAFEFDGATFTQLAVPGEADKPTHLAAFKNHLFLAYPKGQWAHSGIGDPKKWDAATEGAGSGGVGDEIQALTPTVGGALAFFCRNRISILHGSSAQDWKANDFRNQSDQAGAIANSIQSIAGDIIYYDDRGLAMLSQTEKFGNFEAATFDKSLTRYLQLRHADILGSIISRNDNEYRLYLRSARGTEAITATFGQGFEGFARTFYFGVQLTCFCSLEDTQGNERKFAGAADGFVYELDRGYSFNGKPIQAYVKTAFDHLKSPSYKKRWRSAKFTLEGPDNVLLKVKPEFDYGSKYKSPHIIHDMGVKGGGGLWGEDPWGQFQWSHQIYPEEAADISGTGKSMSLLLHHDSDDTPEFTLRDATITYSPRGFTR